MKAVVYEKFGSPDVLEYREVQNPTVKEDDILVKIHASSMNAIDWHIRIPTPSMARLLGGSAKTLCMHACMACMAMFEHYPRKRRGYESYDFEGMIQQKVIAVFQGDPQLTDLFKQVCTRLEKEIASLSKSIRKIKEAVLSQNTPKRS